MKVGILSQWFPPETGPASIPGVLARSLAERGHEVTVLTGFPNYPTGELYSGYRMRLRQDDLQDGYQIRRVALYPDHSNRISGRLLNYASFATSGAALGTSAFKAIDVLWVYNSPATVALPMWATMAHFGTPVVLHNMDMWPDSVIHTGFAPKRGGRLLLQLLNTWVEAMYRSATTIAYISEPAGAELTRRGVPAEKLAYGPIWVDESVFKPADGSRLRANLGYSDDDIVIGYAGALGKAQSVVELVRAIASLPQSVPIRCLIIGSGTESESVAGLARTHPDRVRFIGQVPHNQMTEYSAVPDISFVGISPGGQAAFAAPSKIPAIMACAKPILAVAAGSSARIILDSGAGLVTAPQDRVGLHRALMAIASFTREQRIAMGNQARSYYESHLSAKAGVDQVEALLQHAATQRPRSKKSKGESRFRPAEYVNAEWRPTGES